MLKKICYTAVAFVVIVLAILAGHYLFSLATGTRFTTDQWSAAGAWASAGGATILALVSVGLAVQAGGHARAAEQRAQEEADKTDQRHNDELAKAEARLDRQIKAEWYREQARAIESLWAAVDRSVEPIARLAQVIDEHIYLWHTTAPPNLQVSQSEKVVSDTYVIWKFKLLEVKGALTAADMLIEDKALRSHLDSLSIRVDSHLRGGEAYKNAAMEHGGGAGVSMFMDEVGGFLKLRAPMGREIRRLLASTTAPPQGGSNSSVAQQTNWTAEMPPV